MRQQTLKNTEFLRKLALLIVMIIAAFIWAGIPSDVYADESVDFSIDLEVEEGTFTEYIRIENYFMVTGGAINDVLVLINDENTTDEAITGPSVIATNSAIETTQPAITTTEPAVTVTDTAIETDIVIAFEQYSKTYSVNEEELVNDVPLSIPNPYTGKGSMIALRAVCEAAGYDVSWDNDTRTAHIENADNLSVDIQIDSPLEGDFGMVKMVAGRTFVPEEYVALYLNLNLVHDGDTIKIYR